MSHWLKTSGGTLVVAMLATVALLASCGGSGSTGLILPESALLAEVRESRSCVEANGTTYCAINAAAPRGQQVEGPTPAPAEPCPTTSTDGECSGDEIDFMFRPSGFGAGAACALATRLAGREDVWSVSPAEAVDGSDATISFFADLPAGFTSDDVLEAALLCFDESSGEITSPVARLADLAPDVIFVAPLLPAAGAT